MRRDVSLLFPSYARTCAAILKRCVVDDNDLIVTVADPDEPARMREPEQGIVGLCLRQQGGNLTIGNGLPHRYNRCWAILYARWQEPIPHERECREHHGTQ